MRSSNIQKKIIISLYYYLPIIPLRASCGLSRMFIVVSSPVSSIWNNDNNINSTPPPPPPTTTSNYNSNNKNNLSVFFTNAITAITRTSITSLVLLILDLLLPPS